MRQLSQRKAASEREVSTLRKRLKRPETYLIALLLVVGLLSADASRPAGDQVSADVYIWSVHLYQSYGRPLLKGSIQCRYQPSCSEYSIEAVHRHGLWRGVVLTLWRVNSCRATVPAHTRDPVPD